MLGLTGTDRTILYGLSVTIDSTILYGLHVTIDTVVRFILLPRSVGMHVIKYTIVISLHSVSIMYHA